MTGITQEIAHFATSVSLDDIPDDALRRGRTHMLDAAGLALAGSQSEVFARILAYIENQSAGGTATIFGTGLTASPGLAALANGTAMHADNFDDTNPQPTPDRNGGIHAMAVVLPAAMAIAGSINSSGKTVSVAVHAGLEIACKLNHAMDARHYQGGYHATASLGIFGAAIAAGRLLGLDQTGMANALALATARAGGVRGNFGTMTEQAHCGIAAESGIAAAQMAAAGLDGAQDIFERANGWFEAAGGAVLTDAISGKIGNPWAISDPGTSIKPWPNGALTHPGMSLLLDLMAEHDFNGTAVESVTVKSNDRMRGTLIHDRPKDAAEARFSMPFALAALLVEGKAGLAEFTDAFVNREDVRTMMAQITYVAFDEAGADYTNVTTLIEVRLKDGRTLSGRADFAHGSKQAPMEWDSVAGKFRGCAAFADWPEAKTADIENHIARLEELPDITPLTKALAV